MTLLPFAVMGAITSEAGLSLVEGSRLMLLGCFNGRRVLRLSGGELFLWPPAILLTILLVAIALVGDALRDTLDPKLVRF